MSSMRSWLCGQSIIVSSFLARQTRAEHAVHFAGTTDDAFRERVDGRDLCASVTLWLIHVDVLRVSVTLWPVVSMSSVRSWLCGQSVLVSSFLVRQTRTEHAVHFDGTTDDAF